MRFCSVLFAVVMGAVVLLEDSASSEEDLGLKCWFCNSVNDAKCSDENFTGEPSEMIFKRNCQDVPSPSRTGGISRTIPATRCLKSTLSVKGAVLVSRGCASPGDLGIDDANSNKCVNVTTPDRLGYSVLCLCEGDYCNGSSNLKLATILTMIPLGFALLIRQF